MLFPNVSGRKTPLKYAVMKDAPEGLYNTQVKLKTPRNNNSQYPHPAGYCRHP